MEIMESAPQRVGIRLAFEKPMKASNHKDFEKGLARLKAAAESGGAPATA